MSDTYWPAGLLARIESALNRTRESLARRQMCGNGRVAYVVGETSTVQFAMRY